MQFPLSRPLPASGVRRRTLGALLGAAALGIDATPMEGFDANSLDQELGLREQGYMALVVVGLGYRGESDFNAALPKSRLTREQVFTFL